MIRNWINALRGALLLFFMFQIVILVYTWLQPTAFHTLQGDAILTCVLSVLLALSVWLIVGINKSGLEKIDE